MKSISKQHGQVNLIGIVFLLLFASLSYLGYRSIPLYLEKESFQDGLQNIAGRATLERWDDRKIIQQVVRLAHKSNFGVTRDDVRIHRRSRGLEIVIEVHYTRMATFPGGHIHVFQFHSVAEGLRGI